MKHTGKYRRRFGDRPDGRRIRTLDPFFSVATYIMKKKSSSSNFFSSSVIVTEVDNYLRAKRRDNMPGLGLLHFFIAAYVRIVSQKPALNRFVSGQKIFARYDIVVNLTVKKELTVDGQETTIKVHFDPSDTIDIVYEKVQKAVQEAKREGDSNKTDKAVRILYFVPGLILRLVVRLLEIMDFFGVMPRSLIEASPFHGSIFISDLGSIGLPPVNHHLYDFGNIPMFLCFGTKTRSTSDGSNAVSRSVSYTLTMDDRICDGFYYAGVLKSIQKIFRNPRILDTPPETVVQDIE